MWEKSSNQVVCMNAPANDSSLDRNKVLYIVALREQWSGNSPKLLSSFCGASNTPATCSSTLVAVLIAYFDDVTWSTKKLW